jgi:(+)-neomenthol dehydrogenase
MKQNRKGDFSMHCNSVNDIPFSPSSLKLYINKDVKLTHCGLYLRLAVVTGGNRGIGLEVCRQLAVLGIMVILTARNEKRGRDAVESLRHKCNLSNIIYHPLDVLDDDSVASLAQHIESRYGKLDILVK